MAITVTAKTGNAKIVARFAPIVLATIAIVLGLFVPFFGLPAAMVSVVLFSAAPIRGRRLQILSIVVIAIAVLLNLAMVMMTLPETDTLFAWHRVLIGQ